MKRSCKNIDITDVNTILPWVTECLLRHTKRYDFRTLICTIGGMDRKSLSTALENNDKAVFEPVAVNIAEEASRRIKVRELNLKPVTYRTRIDNSSGKVRLIGNESAMQQVFDYIAVRSCEEIWNRRLVPQQIAGIEGRGAIYGIRMIQKWVDKDNARIEYGKRHHTRYTSTCKYHAKGDVTQCYPSLRTNTFMRLFHKDCANETILWLWEELLNSHAVGDYEGFMIGALCSQWACQYMISFIYRHAMSLHSVRRGKKIKWLSHVAIQMDDILFIGSNRKNLKRAIEECIRYAHDELGLTIKGTWQICKLSETPIDIVGYKIYRNGGISIRARVFLRLRRVALKIKRKGRMSIEQARRLCSYKGFVQDNGKHCVSSKGKHSDSRKVCHRYDLYKLIRIAKNLISYYTTIDCPNNYCYVR